MDLFFFQIIHSLAGRLYFLDSLAIFFAKHLPYILVIVALIFVFRIKPLREKIFVFVTLALSVILSRGIITEVIRFFYDRSRPFEVLDFNPLILDINPSFPSGHAAFFFALSIAIFYFSAFDGRRWGWWFLGFSALNSLARVFVGIHWLSDILGAVVIAFVSVLIVRRLLKSYMPGKAEVVREG
ncbi:MAG: phosphatase PAP2 family protein [Patescibacteria group bacterium]|nr:phosphatase PAP2 family protein [Patescibacteria group bacterium]